MKKRADGKKVMLVAGARPNFVKIAPIMRAMDGRFEQFLVHTGQHFHVRMSKVFFDELDIPEPDINLEVGSGRHGEQTAAVMERIEKVFIEQKPELVLVVGDVNSTMAATLASSKLRIPVAHVEAGLRSFDREMPEEINRVVTDVLSDVLFTTEEIAGLNLAAEGIDKKKVHLVGDVMVDTLFDRMGAIDACDVVERLGLEPNEYAVATIHRQSNADDPKVLGTVLSAFDEIADRIRVVFPCHPRTAKRMREFGLGNGVVTIVEPLGYVDFMKLVKSSRLVMTDSGGLQVETTVLEKPCITLRGTTERPVTIEKGSNVLAGTNPDIIIRQAFAVLEGATKNIEVPKLWDGHAAERIANIIGEIVE